MSPENRNEDIFSHFTIYLVYILTQHTCFTQENLVLCPCQADLPKNRSYISFKFKDNVDSRIKNSVSKLFIWNWFFTWKSVL